MLPDPQTVVQLAAADLWQLTLRSQALNPRLPAAQHHRPYWSHTAIEYSNVIGCERLRQAPIDR